MDDYIDHKHFTFYADLPEEKFDEVEGLVKNFDMPEWLIAFESSPRDHMHFLLFTTQKNMNAIRNALNRKYPEYLKNAKTHGGKRNMGVVQKDLKTLDRFKRYLAKQGKIRGSESAETLQRYIDDQYTKADGSAELIKTLIKVMNENAYSLKQKNEVDLKIWIIKEIFKETNSDYVPSKQMINKVCAIFYRNHKTIDEFYQLIFNY